MGCYRIVAFRESGSSSRCPIRFTDLEAAIFCAEISLLHFGPEYTVAIEETFEDGSEQIIRPADYHAARDAAQDRAAGRHPERGVRVGRDPEGGAET
jgi:hypothetical protein